MRLTSLLVAATLAVASTAKNILLSNDDGFTSTNIRATYYALKNAGHNVWIVAPVSQRSGWAGMFNVPYTTTLMTDGEFSYKKAGEPAWGSEPFDDHIWYFNGTPSSCVSFGLDYVLPKYFDNATMDIVLAGPNEGPNPGPFYFTASGTNGATYYAVDRGLPAISFSGNGFNNSFFKDSLNDDPMNPANIYAGLVVDLVEAIFEKQGDNPRALPASVGLSVNFPYVGSESDNGCVLPKYKQTRLTGANAGVMKVAFNSSSGLFGLDYTFTDTMANCVNGDCSLEGDSFQEIGTDCVSSISVFTSDFDAPLALTKETLTLFESVLA